MAQNERQTSKNNFFADIGLTTVAVLVVVVTFLGVTGLTPRVANKDTSTNVLGVSTSKQKIIYRPSIVSQTAYINAATFSDSTSPSGDSQVTIEFNPLQATTYRFEVITLQNNSLDYKKVRFTPSFSLTGSYALIQLVFAGQTMEIVSPQGEITPLDLVLPPNSSSAAEIVIQPVSPLALPTTLTLSFTELP